MRFRNVLGVVSIEGCGGGQGDSSYTERLRSSLIALISIFLRPIFVKSFEHARQEGIRRARKIDASRVWIDSSNAESGCGDGVEGWLCWSRVRPKAAEANKETVAVDVTTVLQTRAGLVLFVMGVVGKRKNTESGGPRQNDASTTKTLGAARMDGVVKAKNQKLPKQRV